MRQALFGDHGIEEYHSAVSRTIALHPARKQVTAWRMLGQLRGAIVEQRARDQASLCRLVQQEARRFRSVSPGRAELDAYLKGLRCGSRYEGPLS